MGGKRMQQAVISDSCQIPNSVAKYYSLKVDMPSSAINPVPSDQRPAPGQNKTPIVQP